MAYQSPYESYNDPPPNYGPPPSYGPPPQRNAWNAAPPPPAPVGWYPQENDFRLGLYNQAVGFGGAGYFDPRGNQTLIEGGRMNAGRISGALQRRRRLAGQTMGLDPTQRNSFNFQSMLQGSGDEANLYNEALMDAWRRQADYAQQLSLGQYGLAQQYHEPKSPSFGDYAANIIGKAAGAYTVSGGGSG